MGGGRGTSLIPVLQVKKQKLRKDDLDTQACVFS